MTLRAVLLGLLSAALLCAFCYFNDFVMHQTFLVGTYMPISVFGGLLLFLLFINPLLQRIRRHLTLGGGELALIVALTLAACYVPGRGLMHYFFTFMMLPHHYARTDAGWKKHDIVAMAPKRMLADISENESESLNGFIQGISEGSEHMWPPRIPWSAWWRPLGFWLPLLLAFSFAMIGLALVVHRQWSDHEQMPYPIVTFANALMPRAGEARGGVFHNRLFWIGGAVVLVIHLNNYACTWWPRYMVPVPRTFDFQSLRPLIPTLENVGWSWGGVGPPHHIKTRRLALRLTPPRAGAAVWVYAFVVGILTGYGVAVEGGGFISLNIRTFLFGGAYFGMFMVLLYTGRHYYLGVLRRSVFLGGREPVEGSAVWGARVFLVCAGLFAAQLALVGLPWYLAAVYTAGAAMIFTVISRVVSETGVFFIHAYHFPCVMLWGFLGARALGPRAMLIMFMVTSLLLIDPRESVMPFMTQALKLVDLNRVKLGRTARWSAVALCLGFAVAVPVTLYWLYDYGSGAVADGWTRNVPRMSFDATVRVVEKLEAQGNLEQAGTLSGMAWLRSLSPNRPCVLAFGIAMGLVLAFAAARLRFPRWPLHPVMFLILGTFQSRTLAFSFLVGCLIKTAVTKYGGASAYQKLKPLMIGVIAGDIIGGVVPMIIGAIYWSSTGLPPKLFKVLPS